MLADGIFPLSQACCNRVEKLSPKHPAQSFDWEQKVVSCSDPAALIRGQSTGGNQTVEMKMIFEGLVPGVQHGDDTHRSAGDAVDQTPVTFH